MTGAVPTWEMIDAAGVETMAATMRRYLAQLSVSLAPASVRSYDTALREFAGFVIGFDPALTTVAGVDRFHIEAFKRYLSTRHGHGERVVARRTVRHRLRILRMFFERIIEWGYDDAPPRNPIFHGDMPNVDEPLPRFLDDPTAAKFMRALADEPDTFRRLVVEVLARTGIRVGELCGLELGAVVQIGDTHWLRVPVGKLHNDRYVPLHPLLKQLLDDWHIARHPDGTGLLLSDGRGLNRNRVARMVAHVARRAAIPVPTPHQLRHTLATQAINRGMRLEAIAALLGHRSLDMTMTYARIADRTVADEYHAVSDKVDALYAQAAALPADAEGTNMRRLRTEHRRMLGNGYCTRPAELDCQFESICETCTFFRTTAEFAPILQRQRDHAAEHDQGARTDLFDLLLDRINEEKAS